jgi:LmbE family N-acetylglucosaminyl deacetylase
MAEQPIAPASATEVLAIAAHRDDVEQTCGGTLLRMHSMGVSTAILDLTQGEAGTRGSATERAAEATEAARILGAGWREALDIPDGRVENTWENRLKVVEVLRRVRPRVVILPYWDGAPSRPRDGSRRSAMRRVSSLASRRLKREPRRIGRSRLCTPAFTPTFAPASSSTSRLSSRTGTAR